MRRSKTLEWIEAHKDYPHDWCLIWPFARDGRVGRGTMRKANGARGTDWAHRIMCEVAHGPAPADRPQAAHSCGCGHKGCINPRHLSWKNNSENQLDRFRRDRRVNANPGGPKSRFTPSQIEEMRSLYGALTQMEIAARFGCSLGTVQYYLKYRERRGHEPALKQTNGE